MTETNPQAQSTQPFTTMWGTRAGMEGKITFAEPRPIAWRQCAAVTLHGRSFTVVFATDEEGADPQRLGVTIAVYEGPDQDEEAEVTDPKVVGEIVRAILALRFSGADGKLLAKSTHDDSPSPAPLPTPSPVALAPARPTATGEQAFTALFDGLLAEDLQVGAWVIEPFAWRTLGACVWLHPDGEASVAVTPYWEGLREVAVQVTLGADGGEVVEAYAVELPEELAHCRWWAPLTRESYLALLRPVLAKADQHLAARAARAAQQAT
jgi:hypothetical protein